MKKRLFTILITMIMLFSSIFGEFGVGVFAIEAKAETASNQKSTTQTVNDTDTKEEFIQTLPQVEASNREEKIFGRYDNGRWVVEPALDYDIPELKIVADYVKRGKYDDAKESLMKYYQKRDTITTPEHTARNITIANLQLQDIYSSSTDYITFETVGESRDWVTFDVGGRVSVGAPFGVALIARGKEDNLTTFNSKEATENQPYLEVVINGQTNIFYPTKDVTVRAGEYSKTNYGKAGTLEVNDTGYPSDSNHRRAVLEFDLSDCRGTISSAKLNVYGGCEEGSVEIMATVYASTAWTEKNMDWSSCTFTIFSWENGFDEYFTLDRQSGGIGSFHITISALDYQYEYLITEHSITKNEEYARKAIQILVKVAQLSGEYSMIADVLRLGVRGKTVTEGFDYLIKTNLMTVSEFFDIYYFIYVSLRDLSDPYLEYPRYRKQQEDSSYTSNTNWGIIQNTGLYFATNYFYEFKMATSGKVLTDKRLVELVELIHPDGSYDEDSTSYTMTFLAYFYDICKMASINKIKIPEYVYNKLKSCLIYLVDSMLPDGKDPAYGTSGRSDFRSFVMDFVKLFDDEGALLYYASSGRDGVIQDYNSILYPYHNIAIMRTGREIEDMYLHINTYYANHNHADVNSVIMYAYGRNLIVDTGILRTGGAEEIWQRTDVEAHNTLRMDNQNSSFSGFENKVNSWHTTSQADLYQAYTEQRADTPHTRTVLMIADGFFIVSDYAVNNKGGERQYELIWHMHPLADPTINAQTKTVQTNYNVGANLQIVPSNNNLNVTLKQGYYSEGNHDVQLNRFASYTVRQSQNLGVSTVLYPTKDGQAKDVTTQDIPVDALNSIAHAMKINLGSTRNDNVAYYYISNEENPTQRIFGDYVTNGSIAYVENSAKGVVERIVLSRATSLTKNGEDIVSSPETVYYLTTMVNGSSLMLEGDIVPSTNTQKAIKIYAPNISSVYVNGENVEFIRNGDYIYAAKSSQEEDAAKIDAQIDDLVANVSDVTLIKSEIENVRTAIMLYERKNMPLSSLASFSKFEKIENKLKALQEIKLIEQDCDILLDEITIGSKDNIQVIRENLYELLGTYPDMYDFEEFKSLVNRLDEMDDYCDGLIEESKNKARIVRTNSTEDFNIDVNGWAGWYQAYQEPNGTLKLMTEKWKHSLYEDERWAASTGGSNLPHWRQNVTILHQSYMPIRYWQADEDCIIRVSLVVCPDSSMMTEILSTDGADVYVSVGDSMSGYPFVSVNGALVPSNDVLGKIAVDPGKVSRLNRATYEVIVQMKAGERFYIGAHPRANSSWDGLDIDATIDVLYDFNPENMEVEDIFEDANYVWTVLQTLPDVEDITCADNYWINKTRKLLEKYGYETFARTEDFNEVVYGFEHLPEFGNYVYTQSNEGGTIVADKTFAKKGEIVTLTITPNAGYVVKQGSLMLNDMPLDSLNFAMRDDAVNITCEFEKISYRVLAEVVEHSAVEVQNNVAGIGDVVYFEIIVDKGYRLKENSVKVNGVFVDGLSFVMPAKEAVITYEVEKVKGCQSMLNSKNNVLFVAVLIGGALYLLKKKRNIG